MTAVAEKLRRLGLNAEDIARRTQIPVDRVQAILEGASASVSELRTLARNLRLPISSFSPRAPNGAGNGHFLFRATLAAEDMDQTKQRAGRFVDAALKVLPPKFSIPSWLSDLNVDHESYLEAQSLAEQFRSVFYPHQLHDPVLDLAKVLANDGDVVIGRLQQSRYEGASLIAGGYPFILASPRYLPRMLFTIAHELGHLIAHHKRGEDPIFELPSGFAYGRRRSTREAFVDAFASILLLPATGVAVALEKIREVLEVSSDTIGDIEVILLARFFGVSFEVAARRCEDLELLPPGSAKSLLDRVKKEFRNPERRADAIGLPARPKVELPIVSDNLMKAILMKIADGEVSLGWAADTFSLSTSQINAAHAELGREIRH